LDNLTHTLIGIGLARAGLSKRFGAGTTVVLAVASNLPDLDVVCVFGGPLAFLSRRTVTHCLLGMVVLAVLGTFAFRRYYPNLSWPVAFGLTALGIIGHVFCDLWNAYGVILLWPFDWHRFSLNWVYIIDLCIWGILIACLIAGRIWRKQSLRIWQVGLCLLAIYIGVCAWCSAETVKLVREQAPAKAPVYAYPEPLGPQRFRAVACVGNNYNHYFVFPLSHKAELLDHVIATENTPVVDAVRQTEPATRLDWFFSTPVWRESRDHTAANVFGMEFRSIVLKRGSPFLFRVTPEGQVSRERLVGADAN
jgi:membrane-bound metal-dependent hydrolase YbcI (DUF457 family)